MLGRVRRESGRAGKRGPSRKGWLAWPTTYVIRIGGCRARLGCTAA